MKVILSMAKMINKPFQTRFIFFVSKKTKYSLCAIYNPIKAFLRNFTSLKNHMRKVIVSVKE